MLKKRFFRAMPIFLVVVLLIILYSGGVLAGCCVGPSDIAGGCDISFDEISCENQLGSYFGDIECSDLQDCDIGCWCGADNQFGERNRPFSGDFYYISDYSFDAEVDCDVFCTGTGCTVDMTYECPDGTQITIGECDPDTGQMMPIDEDCGIPIEWTDQVIPIVEKECSNGIDDDNDGYCDLSKSTCTDGSTPGDPGCENEFDNDEIDIAQCGNSIDDDLDGLIDEDDPGCLNAFGDYVATDNTEADVVPVKILTCGNGICDIEEDDRNCVYDCGYCGDGQLHNEECETDDDCINGECDACECIYSCDETPPNPLNLVAQNIKGESAVEVSWTLDQEAGNCNLNEVLMYRCSAGVTGDCKPLQMIDVIPKSSATYYEYADSDIKPDQRYCYQVRAYYEEQGIETLSNIGCVPLAGKEDCMDGNSFFCENNILYSCGSYNEKVEVQNCSQVPTSVGEYICLGPYENGNAQCVLQNDCDLCNGLFGLFSIYGETVHLLTSSGGGKQPWLVSCSEDFIEACVHDSTKTNVDKYYFCTDIDSCYDYKSKGACDGDNCSIGGCEWASSEKASSELGVGVCRPKNPEKQDCTVCDTDVSDSRNLFFGACSDQVCRLYGDCYYFQAYGMNYACTLKQAIGCQAYDTKEDCVNADESDEEGVIVDVNHDLNGKRTSGTNTITQASNDYFSYGTCKWGLDGYGAEACIKDADGNDKADCNERDTACQADNTPPETKIIPNIPIDNGRWLLGKNVFLDLETSEPAITYFCFVEDTGSDPFCYPDESTACGIQKKVDLEGDYIMYYYSEDRSHNLEVIKSIPVHFDQSEPNILSGSSVYNKRTVDVTLKPNSNVICSGHLEDSLGNKVYPDIIIDNEIVGSNKIVTRSFADLDDNDYRFVYSCKNRAGNEVHGVEEFIIDNNRVYEPGPLGPIKLGTVDISVKTKEPATCKYALSTGAEQRFVDMEDSFDTTDGLTHVSKENLIPGDFYSYDVKCQFNDGSVEGEKNDRITFGIDNRPPEIDPVSTFAAYGFDQTQEYGTKQTLMLKCKDSYLLDNLNVRNMDFGCRNTIYTYTDPSRNIVTDSFQGELSTPFTVDSTQIIKYNTEDIGGNKGNGAVSVSIDTTSPIIVLNVLKAPHSEASKPLSAVAYGDYVLRVSSSKSLSVVAANGKVFGDNQIFDIPMNFIGTEDFGKIHYFAFSIPWALPEMDDNKFGVNITGVVARPGEFCSVDIALEENKYPQARNFTIDTQEPEADLDPKLNKYHSIYGYPLNYYSDLGKYYTNKENLFITGDTKGSTARVNFYVGQTLGDIRLQQVYEISENAGDPVAELDGAGFIGDSGDITIINQRGNSYFQSNKIQENYFVEFKDERKSYGHFNEFYGITDVKGNLITLSGALEDDVKSKDDADIYDRAHPSDWFGAEINLKRGLNYFYITPESSGGLEGNLEELYRIIYDPDPPEVIKQTPSAGYTQDTTNPISIIVRKPVQSSPLDLNSIKLFLNGESKNIDSEKITQTSDGEYNYYNITYVENDLDGTYHVNFTGYDYALNPLTAASASPEWIFTVNEDSPEKPVFEVDGGVKWPETGDGIWYVKESPTFSLFFPGNVPVNILGYFKNFEGNYINVENCRGTGNLFTRCEFNPQLNPIPVGVGLMEDEYQLIVNARKVFNVDSYGPPSALYLDKFVIDNVTPHIKSVDYPERIRENYDFEFDVEVDNEAHDLNATLLFKGKWYNLTQTGKILNYYSFIWRTPPVDFSNPSLKNEYEGFHTIKLRIADYAGNYATFDAITEMDLSYPDVDNMQVTITPTRTLTNGLVTNQTEITITGTFTDDDVKSVYIMPGDYKPGTKDSMAEISEPALINGKEFELSILLNGTFNKTILNKLNIFMEDEAGYAASKLVSVTADLQPPYVVETQTS